jgi:hypothetical protein
MRTVDEKEGERRKWREGERAREVGCQCVEICEPWRKKKTTAKAANGGTGTRKV